MKVLLATPINRTYVLMPSLGLGYLASVLRETGHDVEILHCMNEKMDFEKFEEFLRTNKFDIIGFQTYTYDLNPVKRHFEIIKELDQNIVTVCGGPHPSGDPKGTLEILKDADFAFTGEAEIGLPKLLDVLSIAEMNLSRIKKGELGEIPGLVWRDNKSVFVNNQEFIEDLDTLSFPAWDLMNPNEYPEAPHGAFVKSFPYAPMMVSRGCPFQCTFCAGKTVTGSKVRFRSIENVVQEIEFLLEKYGVREFLIEDENFTLHKKLVKEFCSTILKKKIKINWSCPSGVRLDTLDKDTLKLMEKSGCHSLAIGIEFGTQKMLDLTKKHLTLDKIKTQVSLFKGVNIKTTGFFLMGYPGETRKDIEETIKLALKLDLDRAQFNCFMPLVGSEIYYRLKEEGGMEELDTDSFFVHDVAYVPEGMTKKELKNLQRWGYLRFYMRPRLMYRLLKEIKGLGHLKFLTKRFLDALK